MKKQLLNAGKNILFAGQIGCMDYESEYTTEKVSPFVLYPNMIYERVRRKECSVFEIHRLIVDGEINETRDHILKLIARFGYINSFLMRSCLRYMADIDLSASAARSELKYLVKVGMLIQYELIHYKDGNKKGSPFVYTISNSALRFVKKQGVRRIHPYIGEPFRIVDVLNLLALNQFNILFMMQYGFTRIPMEEDYFGECFNRYNIPMEYRLRLPNQCSFYLFPFALRCEPAWTKKLLRTLRNIKIYANEKQMSCYVVLVICETEHMAMELERKKSCDAFVKNMEVYYVTDVSLMSEDDVFGRLIDVESKKDYSDRRTFRLDLKQAD